MRTTIRIDDELHARIKQVANRTGRSIGEVIADAVRQSLDERPPAAELEDLPVHGGDGVMPGVDLSANAALRDAMDTDMAVDAIR